MEERILRNIQKFGKRIRRDRFAKVYAPLGDSYRRVGLFGDAMTACQTGLEIFPRYLACREVMGMVHLRQNRLADAKRELEKVREVITDSLELNKALAKVYAKMGEAKKAEPLLDEVIAKDPFDFEMRNFRTQIQRAAEVAEAREQALARGEDPDAIDIYDLAEQQEAVVDIQSIINSDDSRAFDREAVTRATDSTLDNLEGLEESIDSEADRIVERAQNGDDEDAPAEDTELKKRRRLKQEMIDAGLEELSAAAVIAQIELELSLLDEAAILCQRLLKKEPEDDELAQLADKFNQRLEEKEAELDKLENLNLARGL